MKQPDMHGIKRFCRPISYGIIAGAAACLILLVIMSIVMVLQDIPEGAVTLMAVLAFAFGGVTAGFVSSGITREKGLLMGLICGMLLFAVLCLANLTLYGGEFGMQALTKLAAVLFAASIGGVVGVNRRKKYR